MGNIGSHLDLTSGQKGQANETKTLRRFGAHNWEALKSSAKGMSVPVNSVIARRRGTPVKSSYNNVSLNILRRGLGISLDPPKKWNVHVVVSCHAHWVC